MDKVSALLELLRVLQTINPEFPLQYAVCLVLVSQDEGLSLTTLSGRADLSLSTTSRIVGALSQYRQSGKPYNLVKLHIAPDERRRKEIYLTAKGREIIERASAVFSDRGEQRADVKTRVKTNRF